MTLRVNRSYPTGHTPAVAGDLADTGDRDIISLVNDAPRTGQVVEVTVDTASNSTAYALAIDGVTLSITSDASATVTEIADALVTAINNDPLVSGKVIAERTESDKFTVTARIAGQSFTLTESDANLSTSTTTSSDEADPVGFGLAVLRDRARGAGFGFLAAAAMLSAMEVVITPTAVNSAVYNVQITVDGTTYTASFTADGSATVQEIVEGLAAAINGVMPANTVAATEDDTVLTLTAEVAGLGFEIGVGANLAITSQDGDRLDELFAGVSHRDLGYDVEDDGYPAQSAMSVLRSGRIVVETEDTVTLASDVYVRLASTGTIGGFRGSAATGCIRIPRRLARWVESISSTLAVLEVRAEG